MHVSLLLLPYMSLCPSVVTIATSVATVPLSISCAIPIPMPHIAISDAYPAPGATFPSPPQPADAYLGGPQQHDSRGARRYGKGLSCYLLLLCDATALRTHYSWQVFEFDTPSPFMPHYQQAGHDSSASR